MKRNMLQVETLENRVLLDGALGNEIASFSSETELASSLLDRAVSQHAWMFEQPVNQWRCFEDFCPSPVDIAFDGAPESNAGADLAGGKVPTFSDTNTQIVGVDEGDIVETDGEYIYILSQDMVTIVDVRQLAHPRVTSRVKLPANVYDSDMYLDGDRLMVVSNTQSFYADPFFGGPDFGIIDAIAWTPQNNIVEATVIDVSNREDPDVINRTEIDGRLANSRVIDGKAYLVVDDYIQFPQPEAVSAVTDEDGKPGEEFVYESEESYRARVASTILDVMPSYMTVDVNEKVLAEGLVADYAMTYTTGDPNFSSALSVITIDMLAETPSAQNGTTMMTNSGREVFMSRDSLYVFQDGWEEEGQTTKILKYDVDIEEGAVVPVASGKVPGGMLDQFSADEYNGDLRIATTSGWGEQSSSAVYVLDNDGGDLLVKGSVENLAPTERIFSARFMGDRAYVVTFRQVDPLFAINMSDPENPTVEGELKITGFSSYLQPIDENHMIGFGRDADPATGRVGPLQVSLFDVTDMTDPKIVDRYTFEGGDNWTWSAAEHDHHAFRYFPEYKTMAIPVSSQDNGTWIRDENGRRDWIPSIFNQALHVFEVDTETGFSLTGSVEHPSEVKRSVRVGDALYSISADTFMANSLEDPSNQLGKIYFLPPANGGVLPKEPKVDDIDRIFAAATAEEFDKRLDMDGNALVTPDDATFIVETVVRSNRGDTDLDGDVDFTDFLRFAENFDQEGTWAEGDFNGDGVVDFTDFVILAQNFGE